jgi:transcription initiation factor TFIIH subunit 1
MYDQLVGASILSEAEFWRARADQVAARVRKTAATGGASAPVPSSRPPGQRPGLASALLTDVPDGRATFRLTPELVHQIFAERPYVRAAYAAAVPRQLGEAEFWKRYLKHEAVRKARRRARAAGRDPADAGAEDELFRQFRAERAAEAENAASASVRPRGVDPGVDLAADAADGAGEGYGVAHSAARDAPPRGGHRDALAHELNTHGRIVLGGVPASLPTDAADAARELRGGGRGGGVRPTSASDAAVWKERAGAGLDDLRQPVAAVFESLTVADGRALGAAAAAARAARGARAPAPPAPPETTPAAVAAALTQPLPPLPTPDACLAALRELAVDTAPEPGDAPGSLADPAASLPPALAAVLRQAVLTINELLRHFWASVPGRTPARAARAARVAAALGAQYDRLQAMVDAATGIERTHVTRLLKPAMLALDAALARHEEEVKEAAERAGPSSGGGAPMEVEAI